MTCGFDSGCNHGCTQGRYCPGRPKKPAPAWLNPLILLVLVIMFCYVGPAIDDNGHEFAHADETIAQQQQAARFDAAAREMCGENAAWIKLDEGTVQCLTHRGAKTIVAKVGP